MRCCPHCGERLVPALSAADAALLAALWAAIAAEWGTEPWTLREARQRPSVRLVLGARSPASIGRLFATASAEGLVIAGYELEHIVSKGGRTLWRLWRLDRFGRPQTGQGDRLRSGRPSSSSA